MTVPALLKLYGLAHHNSELRYKQGSERGRVSVGGSPVVTETTLRKKIYIKTTHREHYYYTHRAHSPIGQSGLCVCFSSRADLSRFPQPNTPPPPAHTNHKKKSHIPVAGLSGGTHTTRLQPKPSAHAGTFREAVQARGRLRPRLRPHRSMPRRACRPLFPSPQSSDVCLLA